MMQNTPVYKYVQQLQAATLAELRLASASRTAELEAKVAAYTNALKVMDDAEGDPHAALVFFISDLDLIENGIDPKGEPLNVEDMDTYRKTYIRVAHWVARRPPREAQNL